MFILGLILIGVGFLGAWNLLHPNQGDNMYMPYPGNSECTIFGVRRYIKENYVHDYDGSPLSDAEIASAVEASSDTLERGQRLLSFDYYVGDEIARRMSAWAWAWDEDELVNGEVARSF